MDDREYLRSVAQRCFELSGECYHLEIAGKLRNLGSELMAKGSEQNSSYAAPIHQARPKLDWGKSWGSINGNGRAVGKTAPGKAAHRHPILTYFAAIAARAMATVHHHRRDSSKLRNS